VVAALLCVAACTSTQSDEPPSADLAITDVRVFDGERVIENAMVLVDDGLIVRGRRRRRSAL
jgi:hypothetical protein